MFKKFIKLHKLSFAILIFIIIFGLIHSNKPSLIYDDNGGFRQFGLGFKNKTILPIWIFAIIISISSYLGVIYFIQNM